MKTNIEALLLVGPTGAGKTPLGEQLQRRGVVGRRCFHFDFGENLRQIVMLDKPDDVVSRSDICFLRDVLQRGALLEDGDFPIAERVLRRFLVQKDVRADTLVVLNGLPRHVGQASALEASLSVRNVVHLRCSADTVFARIAGNTGGDRTGRIDDDLVDVQRKLTVFDQRTRPLFEYYQTQGVRVIELSVSSSATSEQMWRELGQRMQNDLAETKNTRKQ